MFNPFANLTPIYFLYLLYGASFLFLGVTIATKDMKGSQLEIANGLWLLGAFGILHGVRAWLELGALIEGRHLTLQLVILARTLAAALLIASFLFLLQFGLSLLRVHDSARKFCSRVVPAFLFILWFIYLTRHGWLIELEFLHRADAGARYTFGLAGGLLSSYALIAYSQQVRSLSRLAAQRLFHAGIAFLFYGLFAGIFLSGLQTPHFPVPAELFRTLAAAAITYFIAQALNIFDIETREKTVHQAKLLNETENLSALGQLAAGIAHEINNPLTNASLGVQALKIKLKNDRSSHNIVEKLSAIETNIDRASLIAQELLQFSGQREEQRVPVNVNEVIHSALTLLRYRLQDFELTENLAPLPDSMGDPVRLEQVFINILANSIAATPKGGKVAIASQLKGGMIEVSITDTGSGISAADQSRVFEPFFTTRDVGAGTGLGLFVSYGIVRQHQGQIELASSPGKGTTVTVRLPTSEKNEPGAM